MYRSNQNIKTYHSFKEFSANYENDLNEWLALYPDAKEKDYIQALQNHYSYWFDYPDLNKDFYNVDKNNFDVITDSIFIKQHKSNFSDYVDGPNYQRLSPFEFVSHINNLLTETSENISIDNYSDIVNSQLFIDVIEYNRFYNTNDVISFAQLLEFDKNGKLKLDKHKFKNLGLSVPKIQNFIKEKLNDETPNDTAASIDTSEKYYHAEGDPVDVFTNAKGIKFARFEGNQYKKINIRTIAAIYHYNGNAITESNADEIIKLYGYRSGSKLYKEYNKFKDVKYRTETFERNQDNKKRANDLRIALRFINKNMADSALKDLQEIEKVLY